MVSVLTSLFLREQQQMGYCLRFVLNIITVLMLCRMCGDAFWSASLYYKSRVGDRGPEVRRFNDMALGKYAKMFQHDITHTRGGCAKAQYHILEERHFAPAERLYWCIAFDVVNNCEQYMILPEANRTESGLAQCVNLHKVCTDYFIWIMERNTCIVEMTTAKRQFESACAYENGIMEPW